MTDPPITSARRLFIIVSTVAGLAISSCVLLGDELQTDVATFRKDVLPVLMKKCDACHGSKTQEADLRLDMLDPDLINGPDAETWHDVLNRVNLGEMPPEKANPLAAGESKMLVAWLTNEMKRLARARRNTGGQVVLRRLTGYEFNYTMQDLLGVDFDFAKDLPPDSTSPDGFLNNGSVLGISPLQIELYLAAAREGMRRAIVTGEKPTVYTHRAEKSEKVKRAKGDVSNQLGYNDRFLVRMDEFPRNGEVAVRVTAGTIGADDGAYPRMRIAMGVRADTKAPEMTLAEIDVTASAADPLQYEFRGRIEDFPLPGHNPKFPGLQITIYHVAPDNAIRKGKDKTDAPKIEITAVEFEGPLVNEWPPASHQELLLTAKRVDDDSLHARVVLRNFLSKAYRRPATEDEVKLLMNLYEPLRSNGTSFEEAMREVLVTALISPSFLYLVEPRQDLNKKEALSDFELATRLSYFLWSSLPDDRLFELAKKSQLRKADVLAAEIERMLADPRASRFVKHFSNQWFDLAAIDRIAVNPEYHPGFDDRLKTDMQIETRLLIKAILEENLSALTLLDADFTHVNRRLANHYQLDGPRGTSFERIKLGAKDRRGGLLTQGGFLLANSNGEDSHPIKRAVWLLDRLLDRPPAPPPPDVPDLDPSQPDFAGLTLKQQLEMHRTKQACNNCHLGIDPWGVAFEHFDAVGNWREKVVTRKGKKRSTIPVDAAATLPDGTEIDGVEDLKKYLLTNQRDQFAEATVKRLLTYSLGRSLDLGDQPTIEQLTDRFGHSDYQLRKLISEIIQSEAFQSK